MLAAAPGFSRRYNVLFSRSGLTPVEDQFLGVVEINRVNPRERILWDWQAVNQTRFAIRDNRTVYEFI